MRRRLWQLLVGGAAMVGAAGWWVAIVSLVPAADRPYIGGSQHNSELELIFGYNGFGRLSGNETGSVTGGGGALSAAPAAEPVEAVEVAAAVALGVRPDGPGCSAPRWEPRCRGCCQPR